MCTHMIMFDTVHMDRCYDMFALQTVDNVSYLIYR